MLSAQGRQLRLLQVVSSGGTFPNSIAVSGNLVYVLNAGGSGTLTGYRLAGAQLASIPGSSRSLGLSNSTPPNFLASPGEVGSTPNGSELIVTTKASTSSLDVFGVSPDRSPFGHTDGDRRPRATFRSRSPSAPPGSAVTGAGRARSTLLLSVQVGRSPA